MRVSRPTLSWYVAGSVATVATAGLSGLAGRASDVRFLVAPFPALPQIRPLVASCLLGLATALGLIAVSHVNRATRLAGRVLALAVAAAGLVALGADLFDPDLYRSTFVGNAGEVPVVVAILLVTTGLALAVRGVRPIGRIRPDVAFEAASAALALSVAMAYLGSLAIRQQSAGPLQVAVQPVVALPILALGTMLSRPDRAWVRRFVGRSPGSTLLRRVAPVLLLPPLVGALFHLLGGHRVVSDPGVSATLSATVVLLVLATVVGDTATRLDRGERQREQLLTDVLEQRRRTSSILHALHDGAAVLSRDLRIVEINPRYCEILGRPSEQILGQGPPFPWWVPTAGVEEPTNRLKRVAAGLESGVSYEQTIMRPDGVRISELVTIAPLLDQAGRVRELVASFTDISERVRADELQRRVEQLQRLDSLGKLAGGVAHDFNNLLVVIGGHARILSAKLSADSPLCKSAQRITEAAAKGDALTRQLLMFTSGAPRPQHATDLGRVLTDIQPLLAATLGESVILRMPAEGTASGFQVAAEQGQMDQVLINLAANARDAMPGGGVLSIGWERLGAPPDITDPGTHGPVDWSRLTVSDTGCGMDEATRARVFDPFFTTRPVTQGTGLGLSTVYGIVAGAGGQIEVTSRPGAGSTFEILLPATELPTEPPTVTAVAPPLPVAARVLMVEDQPAVIELAATVLQDAGLAVTTFTEPADAVSAVDRGLRVDLLLTDVIMPGINGPQLAAAVRARHGAVPVLYMSGYTGDVLRGAELTGGVQLLTKPFTPEQLISAVSRALRPDPASVPAEPRTSIQLSGSAGEVSPHVGRGG